MVAAADGQRVADGAASRCAFRVDGTRPLSMPLVLALETVCEEAEGCSGPALVTAEVSGAPGDGDWARDVSVTLVSRWERAVRRLERCVLPTVAVASGDCGGVALDVMLAADVRIAAPGVRLLVATDGEATWPGMAVFRLAGLAGPAGVRRAVLFGTPIAAREALALHLVDELSDDPERSMRALSDQVASCSGAELAIRRQLMDQASWMSFEDALGAHLAACDRALRRGGGRAAL